MALNLIPIPRRPLAVPQPPGLETIRELRHALQLSQRELASKASVSQSFIAKIERGDVDPSYGGVSKIFAALRGEMEARRSIDDGDSNLTVGDIFTERMVSARVDNTIEEAMEMMVVGRFTQLPVMEGDTVVGSMTDDLIREYTMEETRGKGRPYDEVMRTPIDHVMGDPFSILGRDTPIELASMHLMRDEAILVSKGGKVIGILTSADFLNLGMR